MGGRREHRVRVLVDHETGHYNRFSMSRRAAEILESAQALDRQGNEAQAIPLYRQAIRLGLSGKPLRDALVGLGSSLRTTGQLDAARRHLLQARRTFPGDPVVILFLALVEHDAGNAVKALRQVAHLYLHESRHPDLANYGAVLRRKFHGARGIK
jgi:tetratricopeptide (TPR) repeat protein